MPWTSKWVKSRKQRTKEELTKIYLQKNQLNALENNFKAIKVKKLVATKFSEPKADYK